jgi:hypothetical protein
MANPTIKVKRSAVSGKIPTVTQLDLGELALNTFDGKVYIEQDQSSVGVGTTVIVINPWSVGTGTNTYNTYFTAGNVGIGSTIPTSKFSVVGDTFISGVSTASSFSGRLTGDVTGNLNSTGVSTATYLRSTNVNATGLITATTFYGSVYSTGISTISGFKFPSADGTAGQFLKTDGFGNLSFATASGGSGTVAGSATSISDDYFTATQGQTVFTSSQNFTGKSVQVFLNGVKLRTTEDFTTTTPSTVTLVNGATVGDRINIVVSFGNTLEEQTFTATQGQITFSPSGSFASPSNIKVYVNGIKLRKTTDYGASSSVALITAANAGDEIDLVCDNAEDYFTAIQGQTTFTPTSTDITSSNLQVFLNGVRLENTTDYTIGSPAINLVSGLNAGDQVDIVITRT